MRKLYKLDSKGKIRVLEMWTEKDVLVSKTGLQAGKSRIDRTQCYPKNEGKVNATTGEEQAIKEMDAKYLSKMSEGYFKTEEEALQNQVILPMLAKEYEKEKHKIDWSTVLVQPKLDGMRCLVIINKGKAKLLSRKGKEITTVPHILDHFNLLNLDDCVLDGELYAHGLSFQENMKLIKKHRPIDSQKVKFHCYDIVSNLPFKDRYELVKIKLTNIAFKKHVGIVSTLSCDSEERLKYLHDEAVKVGYEGVMIRWGNEPYKVKGRSSNLLKYKNFIDSKVKITQVIPFESRPDEGLFVCELNGKEFKATPKCSQEEKREILNNPNNWVGKTIEIRYFELTDGDIPRFPVAMIY